MYSPSSGITLRPVSAVDPTANRIRTSAATTTTPTIGCASNAATRRATGAGRRRLAASFPSCAVKAVDWVAMLLRKVRPVADGRGPTIATMPTAPARRGGPGRVMPQAAGSIGGPHLAYETPHIRALEAEAIEILREVVAQFERPALLFSGGKDSTVLLRLAEKACWPASLPLAIVHVDTGHNFPEVLAFRDRQVQQLGAQLHVASVQDAIDRGLAVDESGPRTSRNRLQT